MLARPLPHLWLLFAAAALSLPSQAAASERKPKPGGSIVFVSESSGRPQVHLVSPDGSGGAALTQGERAHYPAAAAPDGALAVVAVEPGEEPHREQLLLWAPSNRTLRPLSPLLARARNPAFGPRGDYLVYESSREGFSNLVRLHRAGGGERQLTFDERGAFEPSLGPTGELTFSSARDGDPELYRARPDGSRPVRLTHSPGEDVSPRESPDGRWLCFVSSREGSDRLYLSRPDGSGLRPVHEPSPPGGPGVEPVEKDAAWSPDGRRLAYAARPRGGRFRLWVLELPSFRRYALGDGAHDEDQPTFSPDGKWLAFVSRADGNPELYAALADGRERRRLTFHPAPDWRPLWVAVPTKALSPRP